MLHASYEGMWAGGWKCEKEGARCWRNAHTQWWSKRPTHLSQRLQCLVLARTTSCISAGQAVSALRSAGYTKYFAADCTYLVSPGSRGNGRWVSPPQVSRTHDLQH